MSLCTICSDSSKNTGRTQNPTVFGVVIAMFLWSIKDSAGAFNGFDCSVPLTPAVLTALLNQIDVTKQLLPVNDLENWDSPLPAIQEESFGSGNVTVLGTELRVGSALVPKVSATYSQRINLAGSCGDVGIIFMDDCGNLRGDVSTPGFVRPVKIARNTWNAILDWARPGANAQNSMINFRFDKNVQDGDLGHITPDSYTADFANAEGLLDVVLSDVSATAATDQILFTAKEIYGDSCDLNGVLGLVAGDMTIIINAVTLTITGVAEAPGGIYVVDVSDDILITETGTVTITKDGLAPVTANVTVGA